MPYFLDGNNLIGHARGQSRPSEEDRRSLIAEVAERLRQNRATAVVFFDGPGVKRSFLGSLSIRECGAGGADEAILDEIARAHAPREITLVTADRELARRARDSGARTVSPADFWRGFGTAKTRDPGEPGGKVDVSEWLQWFEDDRNRDREG
jgi:hypothetical protein